MKKRLGALVLSLIGLLGCGSENNCYDRNYKNTTNYSIKANRYTATGIGLDDPKNPEHKLDAEEVDFVFDYVEQCLLEQFEQNPFISKEQGAKYRYICQPPQGVILNPEYVRFCNNILDKTSCYNTGKCEWVIRFGGWCDNLDFSKWNGFKRECIIIKVPNDLYLSESGKWLFECDVTPQACRDKGQNPTETSCNCRGTIQDNNNLIVTHTLELLPGELIRLDTNCNDIWLIDQLKACAQNPLYNPEKFGEKN